jgi:hypothetical protein
VLTAPYNHGSFRKLSPIRAKIVARHGILDARRHCGGNEIESRAHCRVSIMTSMRIDLATVVVLVVSLQLGSGQVLAGDEVSTPPNVEAQTSDVAASPDSLVSREEWKRRVDEARKRAEQARRDWRHNVPLRSLEPDPPEKIATERVLGDDTLQPGDIVSTDKGLFVFRGRSGADSQTPDLVPIAPH